MKNGVRIVLALAILFATAIGGIIGFYWGERSAFAERRDPTAATESLAPERSDPFRRFSEIFGKNFLGDHFWHGDFSQMIRRMNEWQREMTRDFDSGFSRLMGNAFSAAAATEKWAGIHVEEKPDALVYRIQVPDPKNQALKVDVSEQGIRIRGESSVANERNEPGTFLKSRQFSAFEKHVPLPAGVDPKKVRIDQSGEEVVLTFPKT